jgi:hypothetical protein
MLVGAGDDEARQLAACQFGAQGLQPGPEGAALAGVVKALKSGFKHQSDPGWNALKWQATMPDFRQSSLKHRYCYAAFRYGHAGMCIARSKRVG